LTLKEAGAGHFTAFGSRVYTTEDWIVRIKLHDGNIRAVGVQPDVPQESAVKAALLHARIAPDRIADVDVLRRRDYNSTQVAT
jgi:hypothetical protein